MAPESTRRNELDTDPRINHRPYNAAERAHGTTPLSRSLTIELLHRGEFTSSPTPIWCGCSRIRSQHNEYQKIEISFDNRVYLI
jgi:hypothetical protein